MRHDDRDYIGHLFEQMIDEVKAVHELVTNQPTSHEFNELREDVAEVKSDAKVFKATVVASDFDVARLGQRVTWLEAA